MGFLNALYIIPILSILIFVHELGHFVMARRAGVKVEEFGFGLPPRIFGIQRGETLYSINWLPIGGFVRVKGEDGKTYESDSMQSKTAGQRASFLAAGSAMNFIAAFLIAALIVGFQGQTTDHMYIGEVRADSPAAVAGWQTGDQIRFAGGREITNSGQFGEVATNYEGRPLDVEIVRDGQALQTTVTPRVDPPADQGRTGIVLVTFRDADIIINEVPADSAAAAAGLQKGDVIRTANGAAVNNWMVYYAAIRNNPGQDVTLGIERDNEPLTVTLKAPAINGLEVAPLGEEIVQSLHFERVPATAIPGETVRFFFGSIKQMFNGLMTLIRGDAPLRDVAGPIGMGQLTSEVVSQSSTPLLVTLATLTFILSLNLGLLNLLPLPALDGGRLLFVLIEVLRGGKRISPEKEGLVHMVGMALLLTLMVGIAFLDIERLISGSRLLE